MAWKNKTKEEIREYHRKYHHKRSREALDAKNRARKLRSIKIKQEIDKIKSEKGCHKCDENDPVCLDFHHKNEDKEFNIGNALNGRKALNKVRKEIQKCIILCANCHRKLHYYENKQSVAQRESIPFGAEGSLVQS